MARQFSPRRVRSARYLNDLTKAELAAQLGVSASYVNLIECGHRKAYRYLPALADALNVPLDYLFVADDEREVVA